MKTGAVIGITVGAVGLTALAVYFFEEHSKKSTSKNVPSNNSDHVKMQMEIDRILTSDDSGGWKAWRNGNLFGLTFTSAQERVYSQAVMYSGATTVGRFVDYNYPNLQNEINISNQLHQASTSHGSTGGGSFGIDDVLSGVGTIAGNAVLPVVGGVVGNVVGDVVGDFMDSLFGGL